MQLQFKTYPPVVRFSGLPTPSLSLDVPSVTLLIARVYVRVEYMALQVYVNIHVIITSFLGSVPSAQNEMKAYIGQQYRNTPA